VIHERDRFPDSLGFAKFGFEVRLIEGGALVIADLRYRSGQDLQLREPPLQVTRLVFKNADRIGRWLEQRSDQAACTRDDPDRKVG
jgi:hypothetical protein